jgi:hypothetical protein
MTYLVGSTPFPGSALYVFAAASARSKMGETRRFRPFG